jgi:type 1 glutamine amidotransferase
MGRAAIGAAAFSAVLAALVVAVAVMFSHAPSSAEERARLLYFTHSAGFRHGVIPVSEEILKKIGAAAPGFDVTATEDVSVFSLDNLRRFAAVMFFTTGELPMNEAEKSALTKFVGAGGGFLGVHSATDTFYLWPEYLKLIGGYFNEHPWHQKVTIEVVDHSSPLVGFLSPSFSITDEIYQISDFDFGGSDVLLQLDPSSLHLEAAGVHPTRALRGLPHPV